MSFRIILHNSQIDRNFCWWLAILSNFIAGIFQYLEYCIYVVSCLLVGCWLQRDQGAEASAGLKRALIHCPFVPIALLIESRELKDRLGV